MNQQGRGDAFKEPIPGTIPGMPEQKRDKPSKIDNPEINREGHKKGVYDTPDARKQ